MKKKSSGWKGESRRHSLARRGIKTVIDSDKRFAVNNYVARGQNPFATGESLEEYLETSEGEKYLEDYFEGLFEVEFGGWSRGIPYWIDNYEDLVSGENIYQSDFDNEILEHELGYYDNEDIGGIKHFDGEPYYYVGSISNGSGEIELQADNGDLVYDSVGYNYFRVWKPFPETYISWNKDGSYELVNKEKTVLETETPESTIGSIPEFNDKKAIQSMKDYAKKKDWELSTIIWDDSENKFIKG